MRRVVFLFLFSERAKRIGGGDAPRLFFFSPVQQTTSGIGHLVKYSEVVFSGWQPTLNVRNNNSNNNYEWWVSEVTN